MNGGTGKVLVFERFMCIFMTRNQSVTFILSCKSKGLPQQAEVVQGVPGTLRSRIFLTFCTKRVVGRQHYAPATFTSGEIPCTHF